MNFLALLGWSPGAGDREVFSRDELIPLFGLDGISGGNAVFNPEKLDWFNQQYIARLVLSPEELVHATEASASNPPACGTTIWLTAGVAGSSP